MQQRKTHRRKIKMSDVTVGEFHITIIVTNYVVIINVKSADTYTVCRHMKHTAAEQRVVFLKESHVMR